MDSGTGESLSGVWGTSSNDVFAVGGNGTIVHYDGDEVTFIAPKIEVKAGFRAENGAVVNMRQE